MLRKRLRKWLGIEHTDYILAKKIQADKQGTPVYPADDPHPVLKKGYNG